MSDVVVTVTVTMNTPDVISISVDREPVYLNTLGAGDEIRWEIASSGWTFTKSGSASTGVHIKGAGSKFKDKGGTSGQKHHKWERKTKDNKKYRYTISVTNETVSAEPTTLTWDPSIVND